MILRELVVALGLKVDEKSIEKGQRALEGIKGTADGLVSSFAEKAKEFLAEEGGFLAELGIVGAAIGFATHELLEHTEQTAEAGHQTEELAQQLGLEIQELQTLRGGFMLAGASAEAFSTGIGFLSRNMYAAHHGSAEAAKEFARLGVKIKEPNGQLRSTDDVLYDIADKFKEMPKGAEKTGLAMRIFGRGAKELIPALSRGRAELKAFGEESFHFTEEQIKASEDYVLARKRSAIQIGNFWKSVTAPLLPVMAKFEELKNRIAKVVMDLASPLVRGVFAFIAETLKVIASAVLLVVKAYEWLMKTVKHFEVDIWLKYAKILWDSLSKTQQIAVKVALAIFAAWMIALLPFGLMVAAIAAVLLFLDDLRVYLDGGDSVIGRIVDHIKAWINAKYADSPFMQFLGGVVDLFKQIVHQIESVVLAAQKAALATGAISQETFDKLTKKSDADIKHDTNKITIEAAKKRLGSGQGLTKAEQEALSAEGVNTSEFVKQNYAKHAKPAHRGTGTSHRPTHRASSSAGGAGAVQIDGRTTIQVVQRPGEDNKDFAKRVAKIVDERRQTHLQAAKAAVR